MHVFRVRIQAFVAALLGLLLTFHDLVAQQEPQGTPAPAVAGTAADPAKWRYQAEEFSSAAQQALSIAQQEAARIREVKNRQQKAFDDLKNNPTSEAARLALLQEVVSAIDAALAGMHKVLEQQPFIEAAFRRDMKRLQKHREQITQEARDSLEKTQNAKTALQEIARRSEQEIENLTDEQAEALYRDERQQQRIIAEQETRVANHQVLQQVIDTCEQELKATRIGLMEEFEQMKDGCSQLSAYTHTFEVVNAAIAARKTWQTLTGIQTAMRPLGDTAVQDKLQEAADLLVERDAIVGKKQDDTKGAFERWLDEKKAAAAARRTDTASTKPAKTPPATGARQ